MPRTLCTARARFRSPPYPKPEGEKIPPIPYGDMAKFNHTVNLAIMICGMRLVSRMFTERYGKIGMSGEGIMKKRQFDQNRLRLVFFRHGILYHSSAKSTFLKLPQHICDF